jgi:hypothetical protein
MLRNCREVNCVALSETRISGTPKMEKIEPKTRIVVAVDSSRTGEIHTNLVKASTQTNA